MIVSSIIGFCAAPDRVGRVLCWLWWRGQWRCHRQFASNAAGCQGIDMMSYMQGVQGNAHHQSTIKFVVIEVWLGQPWPQAAQDLQPRAALQVVSWYANWWITSMLWLPMEFTVCLLLHLFQSDLESNTEVLEKKKKTPCGQDFGIVFCLKQDQDRWQMQDGRITRWCHNEETSCLNG